MHIFLAALAFLCPIGMYCFFLASVNQRSRPMLVSGRWDTIGLLFAMSGFFLITLPSLIGELYSRLEGALISNFQFDPSGLLWAAYYLALICGGWWLVMRREDCTMIYQVDPERFARALETALAARGLVGRQVDGRWILFETPRSGPESQAISAGLPQHGAGAGAAQLGAIHVDILAAMCHVSLRWEHCAAELRRDIERQLEGALAAAAPTENAAAGWFLTIAGLIFGALLLVVLTILFMVLFNKL